MISITLYTAPWCKPCQTLKNLWRDDSTPCPDWLESLQIIDIDKDPELGVQAGIRGVPTTVISKDGVEVERLIGVYSVKELLDRLNG